MMLQPCLWLQLHLRLRIPPIQAPSSLHRRNGFGRALYPTTCGIATGEGPEDDLSTKAAIMFQAVSLGLMPKSFAKPAEQFELADLDRCTFLCVRHRQARTADLWLQARSLALFPFR